ncbi:MAG TPA: bifunctional phosphoribosylaminoimidazolecarboxamide formyltransferase/IMP cyclohydrolase [Patescibacteria group bacterium]|nr:bifunctional phosphoribosylaminoimidazolecarboxamide formyltransferase/IMP cyclohydrolase [Patescibacteria group bacterium]
MDAGQVKISRALLSVSDKSGLEELARKLHSICVEIISSGGTGKFLAGLGVPFTPVEKITGNPEAFGGRMKTLSFQISSALLFRRGHAEDERQASELGITPIDLVVCNLYPFAEIAKNSKDWAEIIENIDVGGPTMIRAAAKNYASVGTVVDPAQYGMVIRDLNETGGHLRAETRQALALAAFRHTAEYDALISSRMEAEWGEEQRTLSIPARSGKQLRYGENPHQKSWVHADPFNAGLAGAEPIQGKELSYNNLLDADAAWRSCGDIAELGIPDYPAAAAIIKHLSPCGLALAKTPLAALEAAWAGDPISSFGGILCFNQPVGEDIALWLGNKFVEVVVAPSYSDAALKVFAAKPNLRLIALPTYSGQERAMMVRSISGGWVVQQEDEGADADFKPMTNRPFNGARGDLARFGVMACKHLKSNAIGIFAANDAGFSMIGAGMGNPNRLVSMKQAVEKAHENGHKDLSEAVLVSDAFFPFPDNIGIAAAAGIKYIVQPGGSVKDKDVIAACNDSDIAMTFTGRRHFRH